MIHKFCDWDIDRLYILWTYPLYRLYLDSHRLYSIYLVYTGNWHGTHQKNSVTQQPRFGLQRSENINTKTYRSVQNRMTWTKKWNRRKKIMVKSWVINSNLNVPKLCWDPYLGLWPVCSNWRSIRSGGEITGTSNLWIVVGLNMEFRHRQKQLIEMVPAFGPDSYQTPSWGGFMGLFS